jgi:PAS domain S-box-containing protein
MQMQNDLDKDFLNFFNNNLVGMLLTGEDHVIRLINDHLLDLAELERQDVIGKTGFDLGLFSEEFLQKIWLDLTTNEKLLNRELLFKTKSNKIVYCLFSTEKIILNNTAYQFTCIIDITDRKKTERELTDVYERVSDGFVAIDHNWCYSYVNKQAAALIGKDSTYLVGKHVWTEYPQQTDSPFYIACQQAMEKQEMIIAEAYSKLYSRWFQHLIYPSADGIWVIFRDISNRKEAETRLQESELRFKTLSSTAPVGIFETDTRGSTTYVNETWLQYSGMEFEEALGDGWLDAVHPEDREWLAKGWHSKTEIYAESVSQYRIVHKNGKLRWVNGKAVPVFNADAAVKGYIGIILDVTERKEAEIRLEESSKQLRELSRHLQQVREEERTKIAREIHDELGQQLTGLKMDIAWLMKKTGMHDPDIKNKFADTLSLVDKTVRSIRRIATELRPSVIDDLGLNASLEWQVAEFGKRMDSEIEYENSFDDTNMNPDISIGLFRILQESLTNIAKHSGAKKIKINIGQINDAVQLTVEDDGVGFDTKAKKDQLTFGLIGIRERTSMLHGECTVFSEPATGTKIEVIIPLKVT